ncbi:hypothetical protein BDZ94DRAFT_718229 [Collybia nuda]|uniref:C2H2-type domain-containing protein n=1 Tax=Collybia nuda TaxID=64659 RepID=A0A9P6CJ51_9AGAR|nr:hypothetical protein BDZ94DRAFT_718229 [Collybia nuda]
MNAQPALTHSDAASSLLSLSMAAAIAAPIPISEHSPSVGSVGSPAANGSMNANHTASVSPPLSASLGTGAKQHRRLASTGKARRRLSDARDAANRPSPALLQNGAGALSLASLSLSSSPPLAPAPQLSTSFTAASNTLASTTGLHTNDTSVPAPMPLHDGVNIPSQPPATSDDSKNNLAAPIPISKNGRKRGMDHKCESCSKIYRHPSCLIKHRWEHTPHWREASKFVLSKHQQVQLLEAAAILSHLSPSSSTGTSLPDDRSLWPSFLSGGSLPKADGSTPTPQPGSAGTLSTSASATSSYPSYPVSSSVPATAIGGSNFYRSTSTGPRLHDYSIPSSTTGSGGITQLRPGLIGVPNGPGVVVSSTPSMPVPVPTNHHGHADSFTGYRSASSDSWAHSPYENGISSSFLSTGNSVPYAHSDERSVGTGAGGWSLPRSSLRSVSVSSQSRSRSGSASGSRSDDESLEIDVDGDLDEYNTVSYGGRYGMNNRGRRGMSWKREEDELSIGFSVREEDEGEDDVVIAETKANRKEPEWDGLEMEMDMD